MNSFSLWISNIYWNIFEWYQVLLEYRAYSLLHIWSHYRMRYWLWYFAAQTYKLYAHVGIWGKWNIVINFSGLFLPGKLHIVNKLFLFSNVTSDPIKISIYCETNKMHIFKWKIDSMIAEARFLLLAFSYT